MKIIIINGPCGVGKSTMSEKLHDERPLSFLLDIDAQRRFISKRREFPKKSSPLALIIAKNILETCLANDTDVIIDKMIFDQAILNSYYEIAKKYNAEIYEIILWASKEVVMKRADERGYVEGAGLFTPQKCEHFWDEIDKVKDLRMRAHIVNTEQLNEEDVLVQINNIIGK